VFRFTPVLRPDPRGVFLETFKESVFSDAVGRPFGLKQANISVSRTGTVRGIHFASVPPGQAKYVQCVAGSVIDIIVDIRLGSPTFGSWDAVELNDRSREAVFIPEGLGHGFCALTDSATLSYFCSEPYAPEREFGIHPLDPDLALPWPANVDVVLSEKDADAPTLAVAAESGLLPDYAECLRWYEHIART
jgi:dTDP-4-dehydrorhamnose 3,5-epimerase